MKICIDTRWISNQNSGVGKHIEFLLQEIEKRDLPFETSCFGSRVGGTNMYTFQLEGLKKKLLQSSWKNFKIPLLEALTGNQDLFHFTNMTAVPNKAKKSIVTIHDLAYLKFPETIERKNLKFLNKTVPWTIDKASHVIAVSEATKTDIIDYFGYPKDKISVVYNGVEQSLEATPPDALKALVKRKYDLKKDFIFSVSTIEPRKDYETMIRGFAKTDKSLKKQYDLVICGGVGWSGERNKIEKLIYKYDLQNSVKILGYTSFNELKALYSLSALYLHTSLYEGFGMSMVEAMGYGIPIVASNTSCHAEILGNAAIYFEVSNSQDLAYKIELALTDIDRRAILSQKGKKQASKFSWKIAAEKTAEIYKNTLLGY